MTEKEEITDTEAMDWLNENCLSIRVGNPTYYVGSWNVKNNSIIGTAKRAMLRLREAADEKEEREEQ